MSSQTLHQLIKSLSSTEKGYIKKQSSVHVIGEQNKYIRLFDAIDKQREYSEKDLIKKFKDDPILNNFAVAKNYLYRFIMKSLESYHSSVKSDLRSSLNQIEILYNKNLPGMARKIICKAKLIAQQYELYEFMEELIDWEIIMLVEEASPETYLESVEKHFSELYDSIEKKKTIIGYKHLYQRLRSKGLFTGFARNDEDVMEFEKIAAQAQQPDSSLLNTFNAEYHRNLMQVNFYFMLNEQEQANAELEKMIHLLERNPHMVEIRPFTYLAVLRNKAVNELALMRYAEVFKTIRMMDDFVVKYGHINKNFELLTENLKLFIYLPTGQFEKALQIAEKVDLLYRQLPVTRTLQKEKQLQHYAFAYIHIGLGNYRLANQHLNILVNDQDFDLRSDLYCFAHILSLIVHYELGNTELLEYRIRSTVRLLLRRNKLHNFEKQILQFLKGAHKKGRNPDVLRARFIELRKNLEPVVKGKIERNALSLFDLMSWLDSKIDGISFMDVKQQKFNNLMAFESSHAHMH